MISSNMPILKHGFTFNESDFLHVKRRGLFCESDEDYSIFMTDITDDTKIQLATAERIREAIASKPRGIKVRIANKCDVKPQAITGWEKLGKIDKNHLAVVADETGYSLDWLITGKGEKLQKKPLTTPVFESVNRILSIAMSEVNNAGIEFTDAELLRICRACIDLDPEIKLSDNELREKIQLVLKMM